MDASPAEGVSEPLAGEINPQVKLRVPFTVKFTPNPDFQFIRWQAFDRNNNLLSNEIVRISDPEKNTTTIEIMQELYVKIQPKCEERPYIMDVSPRMVDGRQPVNHPVKVSFSRPIKADANLKVGKNIQIRGRSSVDTEDRPLNEYFDEDVVLSENNTILTIKTHKKYNDTVRYSELEQAIGSHNITILFLREIAAEDSEGRLIAMEKDVERKYQVSASVDTEPPVFKGELYGARDKTAAKLFYNKVTDDDTNKQYRRLMLPKSGNSVVYLVFSASDNIGIESFTIKEYTTDGGDTLVNTKVVENVQEADLGQEPYLVAAYKDKRPGAPYVIPYELATPAPATTDEKTVKLMITASDGINSSTAASDTNSRSKTIAVYLDKRPPLTGVPSANSSSATWTPLAAYVKVYTRYGRPGKEGPYIERPPTASVDTFTWTTPDTGSYNFYLKAEDDVGNVYSVAGNLDPHVFYYRKINGTGEYFVRQGIAGNGASWNDPSNDLQKMMNLAYTDSNSGAIPVNVYVAAGTYKPEYSSVDYSKANTPQYTFFLRPNVTVYGGYMESDFTNPPENRSGFFNENGAAGGYGTPQPTARASILSGGNAVYNVVNATGSGIDTSVLDGFTITGGNANVSGGVVRYSSGGGIYIEGSPVLTNITVSRNTAMNGGGIYIYRGSPKLTNATVLENKATVQGGGGGGMRNDTGNAGSLELTNVTIFGNTASDRGGGVYVGGGTFTMTGGTITNNTATNAGGGVYISSNSTFNLNSPADRSNVTGNTAGVSPSTPNVYLVHNGTFKVNGSPASAY